MPKVTFVNEKKEIEIPDGANLRDEAIKAGIQVNFMAGNALLGKFLNCRGHGTCVTCHVLGKKGMDNLSPKGKWERNSLALMVFTIVKEEESRLACQTQIHGDCTIQTNHGIDWSGEVFWQKPYPNK